MPFKEQDTHPFTSAHETSSRSDHTTGHTLVLMNLRKLKSHKVFSHHNMMTLEINYKKEKNNTTYGSERTCY